MQPIDILFKSTFDAKMQQALREQIATNLMITIISSYGLPPDMETEAIFDYCIRTTDKWILKLQSLHETI